eukprot:scaffold13943_cov58-Cyclotella_meneghiniana.AAC.3
MTATISQDEIMRRFDRLKSYGAALGSGRGRIWIILDERSVKVERRHPGAIQLREIVGVDNASLNNHFGRRWRGKVTEPGTSLGRGFTHRMYSNATFVSVGCNDDISDDVPNSNNILRGDDALVSRIRAEISADATEADNTNQEHTKQMEVDTGDIEPIRLGTETITPNRIDTVLETMPMKWVPRLLSSFNKRDINQVFGVVRSSNTILSIIANANREEDVIQSETPSRTGPVSSIILMPLAYLTNKYSKRR